MSTNMTKPIVIIIGTRPEGIKMIPVYFALRDAGLPVLLCSTSQHNELLSEVFSLFGVTPDIELRIMRPGQDLFYITSEVLLQVKTILKKYEPSIVLVHGDTTTTMAASLAAFYSDIPIAHVEAGLRTSTIRNPFPEEMNRRFVGMITRFHFAPTPLAVGNLLGEGIDRSYVYCTGNTVVDALRIMKQKIEGNELPVNQKIKGAVELAVAGGKQIVLLTAHRRESFDGGIERILSAMKQCATERDDILFFYPYHPNPNVLCAIESAGIKEIDSILMMPAISYADMIYLLLHADWVATDSGGISEEAVSLGKQVLYLRDETERAEGIWAGYARLVGTETTTILAGMRSCIEKKKSIQTESHVYGDGYAAQKIAHIIQSVLAAKHPYSEIQSKNNRASL